MERQIDFARTRHMLCAGCGHRWVVDLDWIDRWEQGQETCPGCGVTCEHEDSPRVTVDPDDPVLDDGQVAGFVWYHTSTHADWPTSDFDPEAELTAETRRMMGGEVVAVWVARQRANALHVGTYEAAIHNMLRRMRDQADRDSQFHLYRVRLKPSVTVRAGWLVDPGDWVGDVMLHEACPPGVDAARYLNLNEDPGGLSLALGRSAIASVQQVAIPLADAGDDEWVHGAVEALGHAEETVAPSTELRGWRHVQSASPRFRAAQELVSALAGRLPVNLRDQFTWGAAFADGDDPEWWARRTSSLAELIQHPGRGLAALDQEGWKQV